MCVEFKRKRVYTARENPDERSCVRRRRAVCSRSVTHDELRAALPPYAAGELEEKPAAEVRAHLAAGCENCLASLFRLPVGRPRDRWQRRLPRPGWLAPATTALLAIALAVLVGWTIRDLTRREAEQRAESERAEVRMVAAESARAAAAARAAALLYAFGLPSGQPYRIELQLDDGRVASGPAFEVGADGDAVVPIRLPVVGARIRGTTVVRDPGGQTVLAARLGGG